jgi:hypothetical protein
VAELSTKFVYCQFNVFVAGSSQDLQWAEFPVLSLILTEEKYCVLRHFALSAIFSTVVPVLKVELLYVFRESALYKNLVFHGNEFT